jgi:hypothetical protein
VIAVDAEFFVSTGRQCAGAETSSERVERLPQGVARVLFVGFGPEQSRFGWAKTERIWRPSLARRSSEPNRDNRIIASLCNDLWGRHRGMTACRRHRDGSSR